jgi:histidine phosphotransferase ChpT
MTDASPGPSLSALVSARLCHDLISPMGAIGNGLELLQMAEGGGKAELALISDSLRTALAKLRFYRIAFGPADAEARQSFEEAGQITAGMYGGRFTVSWEADARDMPRPAAQVAYLAILCLEKSLPMGGAVRVGVSDASGSAIRLESEGRRTAPPAELWAHVTQGTPVHELRSDAVQFALLRAACDATGHRIAARFTDTEAVLDLTAPSPVAA